MSKKKRGKKKPRKKDSFWITLLVRRDVPLLFQYPIYAGANRRIPDLYGLDIKFSNYLYRSPDGPLIKDIRELEAAWAVVKKKFEKGLFSIFVKPVYKQIDKLMKIADQISALSLKPLDNTALLSWFENYMEELEIYCAVLPTVTMVSRIAEKRFSKQLKETLKSLGEEDRLEYYLNRIVFPTKKSPVEEATFELTKLAAKVQSNSNLKSVFQKPKNKIFTTLSKCYPKFLSQIEDYVRRFAFINADEWIGKPLSIGEALSDTKTLLELKDPNQVLGNMQKQQERREREARKIIKKLGIKGNLSKLIEFLRELYTIAQSMRAISLIAGFKTRKFITEIGKRLGFSYEEMLYFTPPEVVRALKGKIPRRRIRQRLEEGYGLYILGNKYKILVGKELKKEMKKAIGKVPKEKEIIGRVAYKGKYKGQVKIIYTRKDTKKMQGGDVLVSPMTDPYLVPAMIKAGALVTDEGGITCHAAIVSREFEIPCIVGTGNATQVLKDGDLVEVDANKGVVKKLSA